MSIRRVARKLTRTLLTPVELSRLLRSEQESGEAMARALRRAMSSRFSAEEQAWIDKIESQRKRLPQSTDTIPVDTFFTTSSTETAKGGSSGTAGSSVKGEGSKIENIRDVTFASVKPSYGQMLYALVRDFKPQQCLELGTCLGISSAFIASALQLNGGGSLVTFEGSASRSGYAQSVLKELELENIVHVVGPFQQTLVPQLKNYRALDFCYIAGHHDGKATVSYFESILPLLPEGAVVVIDDITWSGGMKEAWSEIKSREEVALSVDTYMMGICQIRRKPTTKQSYRIMYW